MFEKVSFKSFKNFGDSRSEFTGAVVGGVKAVSFLRGGLDQGMLPN